MQAQVDVPGTEDGSRCQADAVGGEVEMPGHRQFVDGDAVGVARAPLEASHAKVQRQVRLPRAVLGQSEHTGREAGELEARIHGAQVGADPLKRQPRGRQLEARRA